jgi:predicted RNase H-like nuclease (RuvC/YqgF family)
MPFVLELTLALITGGVIQAVLSYLIRNRKETRMDMDLLVARLKQDNDRLRDEEAACKGRIDALDQKVIDCHAELIEVQRQVAELYSKLRQIDQDLQD